MRHELQDENRIAILDGFRAIAIISVVLFHYYSHFDGQDGNLDLYQYSSIDAFEYGYFGVSFFFTISGFVIFRSLQYSTGIGNFLAKRYLRLLPAMALCSIITFIVQNYLNHSGQLAPLQDKNPLHFLFSFTFIHPKIWNQVFSLDSNMIDRAYWSLWAEVVFYLFAALVYFCSSRRSFLGNWLKLVLAIQIGRIITSPRLETVTPDFLLPVSQAYYQSFLFLELSSLIFFSVGILFYALWNKEKVNKIDFVICAVLFILQIYFIKETGIRVLFVLLIMLWRVFIFAPRWLKFLEWRPIVVVGLVSYPLYLLHQNVGLIISDRIITLTSNVIPPIIVPVFVLFLMILVSYIVFAFYERPVMRKLRSLFLQRKNAIYQGDR